MWVGHGLGWCNVGGSCISSCGWVILRLGWWVMGIIWVGHGYNVDGSWV